MSEKQAAALSPDSVIEQMRNNGVSHVVWLPDSETNHLFLKMRQEGSLALVGVSREGHACSIASGLYAGGAKPIILIQNTGLMESGDSIRGWLFNLRAPVVFLVGYRGYTRHGVNKDSAATYTERFLMAFDLPFYMIESNDDAERISVAFAEAERTSRPVVVLVADEFHGFNQAADTMMYIKELVAAFAPHRGTALVVSGRAGKYWREFSEAEFDLPLGDPSMGGHAGFSLGLALAQPDRPVVLFDTEGDLLMNLGILATIAEQAPRNFYYFLMDNEVYATTGGQPVPNAQKVAYDAVARACGIERTHAFTEIEQVSKNMAAILANPGPVFVWNKVHPEIENLPIGQRVAWRKRTPAQVINDTRQALGASSKR